MLKIFWIILAGFFVIALNKHLSIWLMPKYSLYDIKRILEIILLLWTSFYLLFSISKRRAWLNLYQQIAYPSRLLILGIFTLGLLSTLFAPITKMALLEVTLFFLLFTFSLFIAAQRTDKVLLAIIILGLVIYEITVLYTRTISVGFANHRFLNQYLIWVLPLVTLPLDFTKNKKTIIYIIAIGAWIIALANFSKGMILSLLIAYILVLLLFQKTKSWFIPQLKIIGISIIIAAIGYLLLPHGSINIGASFTARLALWNRAIHLIIAHPILGVGPMHYSYYINNIAAHPHNSLLLIASEWGLPALLLILILFAWGLIAWIKYCKQNPSHISFALTSAFMAGSCYSLVSGVLITSLSQIMMCLILGWMLGIYYSHKTITTKISILTEIVFMIFLLFTMAGLVIGIIPTIFYLPDKELNWLFIHNKANNLIFNPRFWLQGWLR